MPTTLFLHGLDSSSQGSKGRYFREHFPGVLRPDFSGNLATRLSQLEDVCKGLKEITLIGSSFGGLMATSFAISHPERVHKLILLAPALNFADFKPPANKITTPTLIIIGKDDTVCPAKLVLPLAEATFSLLKVRLYDDDHAMKTTFQKIEWQTLLSQENIF